jgi:hypothetical protein
MVRAALILSVLACGFATARADAQQPGQVATTALERETEYVSRHYHQPSDGFREDFEYDGLLQQARLLLRLAWELTATTDYPAWGRDSEFRPAGERLRLKRLREATPQRFRSFFGTGRNGGK